LFFRIFYIEFVILVEYYLILKIIAIKKKSEAKIKMKHLINFFEGCNISRCYIKNSIYNKKICTLYVYTNLVQHIYKFNI